MQVVVELRLWTRGVKLEGTEMEDLTKRGKRKGF